MCRPPHLVIWVHKHEHTKQTVYTISLSPQKSLFLIQARSDQIQSPKFFPYTEKVNISRFLSANGAMDLEKNGEKQYQPSLACPKLGCDFICYVALT